MKKYFGILPSGTKTHLYTISCGRLTAEITDYGATLVKLWVPDAAGNLADVVLGHDSPQDYLESSAFFGATVGRSANRIQGASFQIGTKLYSVPGQTSTIPAFGRYSPIPKTPSRWSCIVPMEIRASPVMPSFVSPILWTHKAACM